MRFYNTECSNENSLQCANENVLKETKTGVRCRLFLGIEETVSRIQEKSRPMLLGAPSQHPDKRLPTSRVLCCFYTISSDLVRCKELSYYQVVLQKPSCLSTICRPGFLETACRSRAEFTFCVSLHFCLKQTTTLGYNTPNIINILLESKLLSLQSKLVNWL